MAEGKGGIQKKQKKPDLVFFCSFFLTFPILSLTIVVYATIAITHKQEAYDL